MGSLSYLLIILQSEDLFNRLLHILSLTYGIVKYRSTADFLHRLWHLCTGYLL